LSTKAESRSKGYLVTPGKSYGKAANALLSALSARPDFKSGGYTTSKSYQPERKLKTGCGGAIGFFRQ